MISAVVLLMGTPLVSQVMNFEEKGSYQKYLEAYQYKEALQELNKIPKDKLSIPDKKVKMHLEIFIKIENSQPDKSGVMTTDEDVGPDVVKKVKRYYRQSQKQLLKGHNSVARDILIYILYLYPGHHQASKLLEWDLGLTEKDYKVEDVVKKYYSRSDNYFYGGNYLLAKKDLEVLAILEKDDPSVFEKLGSTYYMMNEKQRAIDTWTTALFLDPDNTNLKNIIQKTKVSLKEEAKRELAKRDKSAEKVVIEDPQVMGVHRRQSAAFGQAEALKKKGLRVSIEETDKGRWKVIVSRSELSKLNTKK